jgi:hypothetical protein
MAERKCIVLVSVNLFNQTNPLLKEMKKSCQRLLILQPSVSNGYSNLFTGVKPKFRGSLINISYVNYDWQRIRPIEIILITELI